MNHGTPTTAAQVVGEPRQGLGRRLDLDHALDDEAGVGEVVDRGGQRPPPEVLDDLDAALVQVSLTSSVSK